MPARARDARDARPAGIGPAAIALLAAAVAGCELTSIDLADTHDVVVAEVVLRPGTGTHRAFLHRTVPGPDGSRRVPGAALVVRDAAGHPVVVFQPEPDVAGCVIPASFSDPAAAGSCYTAAEAGEIQPGGTYDLEITLPGGGRLDGRATAPGAFRVVSPAADTCVAGADGFDLVWTASAGAWAYQAEAELTGLAAGLAERGVSDPPDTLRLTGLAVSAADTSIAFPEEFGVFDRFQLDIAILIALRDGLPEGARAAIVVAAGDPNYINWVRGGAFNPSGQVRIPSLMGAGTGVFGILIGEGREVVAPGPGAEGLPPCSGP